METAKRRERSRGPWSRLLIAIAVGGPALAIGGVHPEVVPAFAAVVLVLWLRITGRAKEPLRVPWVALVGAGLAAFTLLQWLPIPGLRGVAAPGIEAMIDDALAGSGVSARAGLSVSPSDTLLEVSRLAALVLLTIAAAQVSWRVTAAFVAVTGTLVAAIGLAHGVLGVDAIYGIYEPEQVDRAGLPALMGTFVNANHQSGLLLLGTFSAMGLALDQHTLGLTTRDASKSEVYRDRFLAMLGAVAIQVPALVLSLSRAALVAFAIVAPIAAVIALRRTRAERRADPRRAQPAGVRLLIAGGLVVLVAVVAQHGAWRELATLWSEGITDDRKVVMFEHAPALISLSPVLGIGRGAFIDLYPSVEPRPSYVLVTHLESAPMAMIVEWGPLVGGLALVAFACWFVQAMWYGGHKSDARPRRVVLLGLLALAIHQSADFALDFLGVAAPACALAGALSPARWIDWQPARARIVGIVASAAAILLGVVAVPGTWSHRGERDDDDLSARPLDATLHAKIARSLLANGDIEEALVRATAATKLQPGGMEGWLLRSDAAAQLHDAEQADDAMRRALVQIHVPPGEELVDYLVSRYPSPDRLAAVAPSEPLPWRLLVRALEVRSPDHADAVARVRAELDPTDPEPLVYRSRIALARGNAALSLHHARLLRQAAPELAASHLSIASALAALGGREAEIVAVLEGALAEDTIADPAERGRVEEHLVRVLLSRGDDASLARARELVPDLVARPASRDVRRRRRELAKALDHD